jgi:hypothetical protein
MGTEITALPASAGLVSTDILPVVDDPAGTPATQKATFAQVLALVGTGNTNEILTKQAAGPTGATNVKAGSNYISIGASPAATGGVRLTNNSSVSSITTGAADVQLVILNNFDQAIFGGTAVNTIFSAGAGGVLRFRINGIDYIETYVDEVRLIAPLLDFASTAAAPAIKQRDDATNAVTGDALTIQAQNCTGTTTTGGNAILCSGTGTSTNGSVKLQVGGTDKVTVAPSTVTFVDPVTLTASAASAGDIRAPTAFTLKALTSGGGSNKTLMQFDSSNVLNIGGTNAQSEQASTTYINASGTVYGLIGSTTMLRINSSGVGTYYTANMGLSGNSTSFPDVASGVGVFGVGNCNTAPSATPTGGGVLYAEAGAGKWKGSSGTVTTFGPAEPHCPTCGRDFAIEHENSRLGERLALCLPCLVDALKGAGVDTKKFTIADKRGASKADWAALVGA